MLLFYAWTDVQIINATNLKINHCLHIEADLIVFKLSRVSECIIEGVKAKEIFCNVMEIEIPEFYKEKKRSDLLEKFQAIFYGPKYRKYFFEQLDKLIGGKKYNTFFTGAFWSETLLVLRYIKKNNSKIDILLYDEGLAAYNGSIKWLFRAVPDKSVKAMIRTILYYGISSFTYRKYVKGIYLYKPELSNIDYMKMYKLVASSEILALFSYEATDDFWSKIYEESDLIYIAEAPNVSKNNPMEPIYQSLNYIYELLPDVKIVLKVHPIMSSMGINIKKEKYANLYIDNRNLAIESILYKIDIDKKIVITGNSTSALYLKWVYEKTPYILFLENKSNKLLYNYYEKYIALYDENKAHKVKNMDELCNAIKNLSNLLYGKNTIGVIERE